MFVYLITIILVLGYGLSLFLLKKYNVLSSSDFVNNFTIFVGWIVALSLAWIHLQKTRRDNQLSKKEEIKKMLEINAFREINNAVNSFSSVVSSLSISFLTLPGKLKFHIKNSQIFRFNKVEIDLELNKQTIELYNGIANFIRAIESNEIVILEFDHYRKYIQHRVDDIHDIIRQFRNYFGKTSTQVLITQEGCAEFEKRCNEIYEQLTNIQSYLFDYRIELMNSKLQEIFDRGVPERKPLDLKYKTLKELAIKKEVEKESKERELRAIKGRT